MLPKVCLLSPNTRVPFETTSLATRAAHQVLIFSWNYNDGDDYYYQNSPEVVYFGERGPRDN